MTVQGRARLDPEDRASAEAFIRGNTRLLSPPLVPEIRLHLAEESLPIWQKTEEELGEMNVPPPYWAFAWAGGQALARYLLDTPAVVAGGRVLDVGSGSGLTAIAAKKAGAAHVLAADIDAFALAAIALNAAASGVSIETSQQDPFGSPAGPWCGHRPPRPGGGRGCGGRRPPGAGSLGDRTTV